MFAQKTVPFRHQEEVFQKSKDLEYFGILWEMGCGKTKTVIDTAAYLFDQKEINGLLVLAPNGVHRNWVSDELPTHMSDDIRCDALVWYSGRAGTQSQRNMEKWLLEHDGLSVLVMSYDGFVTAKGKAYAKEFLTRRKCKMVLDEAELIKSPGAHRTKLVLGASKFARYRRILTGTPVANSPFDIYAPFRFLDLDFWKQRGIGGFVEFKSEFAVLEQIKNGTQQWERVKHYKRLDVLRDIIRECSSRLLKEDVLKDLPPKLYTKRYFELSKEQRRVYQQLKDEFIAQLASGEEVTAVLALVRMMRFCQVTSNYLPADQSEDGVLSRISEENPRLDLLEETIESVPHQAIIWARFRNDIQQIREMLNRKNERCVIYDGSVNDKDRALNIDKFKRGDVQFFVANPAAIGRGVTLVNAKTVVYYNNSFRLVDRLQSEDRAHRIGQDVPVQYVDIVAENTIDERIVAMLRQKFEIAAAVTGDRLREWL